MSLIHETIQYVQTLAETFGATGEGELPDYIFRNNTSEEALKRGGAYFGFVSPDEEQTGPYHDLSLVIFPANDPSDSWLVSLGVGTLGFKNDYELASLPGIRRRFSSLIDKNGFCKTSILDIESNLPLPYRRSLPHLKRTLDTYQKLLPVSQIIDEPGSETGRQHLAGFVAAYASIRNWADNKKQRDAIAHAIAAIQKEQATNQQTEVLDLVKERRFVILQGAPGTGKTRLAKLISERMDAKRFFTQFHAQTDYSEFIYGITPRLNHETLTYGSQDGIFLVSLKYAEEHPSERVVLIIDEINRANLSNILGPVFYLFEHKQDDATVSLEVGNGYTISKIPSNYYVIATMNTADRSLAVVDFALRRRFAWYTLKPKRLSIPTFYETDFSEFERIFDMFASSEELNLQPGQAYFIADTAAEMENRIRYELLPLIREYLLEGLLALAKEEFARYFYDRIGEVMFE